jgi:hypothetical protein
LPLLQVELVLEAIRKIAAAIRSATNGKSAGAGGAKGGVNGFNYQVILQTANPAHLFLHSPCYSCTFMSFMAL